VFADPERSILEYIRILIDDREAHDHRWQVLKQNIKDGLIIERNHERFAVYEEIFNKMEEIERESRG